MDFSTIIHSHIAHGMLTGWLAAAAVDFRTWQSFSDVKKYDWNVAGWRWLQGAIVGALTGGGFSLGA